MQKGRPKIQIDRQSYECIHSSKFHRAAEQFEEGILAFLRVVREVLDHIMEDQCGECQTNLVRGYQFPEGCTNPPLGHQVTLYSGILSEHNSVSMERALNFIEVEHRDLAHVVRHVRKCVSCATAVGEYRNNV